ncbi:MAG: molybdopterin converting factor subunit 1 [Pseudomonadales bacterium]|nr:molybdopterin converting factor subunit 1 [Pseudomonadales bacterium]
MIQIHYFASIREQLEKDKEQISLPDGVASIDELISHLQTTDPKFNAVINTNNKVLVAVNQTVVDRSYKLSENDEIAFFPPMTGG